MSGEVKGKIEQALGEESVNVQGKNMGSNSQYWTPDVSVAINIF